MRTLTRRGLGRLLAGGAAVGMVALPVVAFPSVAGAQTSSGPITTPITIVPTPHGCSTGYVPAFAVGNPSVHAGEAEGYYIWHNRYGWHLRVTHPGTDRVTFSGTITATGNIVVTGEPRADIPAGNGTKTLQVSFADFGGVQGVNFTASCAKDVHFNLKINGVEALPSNVYLGQVGDHPTSNPFTIERLPYTGGPLPSIDASAN